MVRALDIVTPGIHGALTQVIHVALIGIGLALKRDVAIGIAAHGQPDQPFDEIGKKEEDKEHFTLLGRVNALMVHHLVAQVNPRVHKKHSQQIDGSESPEWQYRSTHNFHCCKYTQKILNTGAKREKKKVFGASFCLMTMQTNCCKTGLKTSINQPKKHRKPWQNVNLQIFLLELLGI